MAENDLVVPHAFAEVLFPVPQYQNFISNYVSTVSQQFQHRYGSYESHPPAVVRLNQNYNAYNEYRPAAEYNPSTMTRQQASPFERSPEEIWRHTSQVPTFRPRDSNYLKRRRSRSHLDDIFRPNHDEDEDFNNSRPERNTNRYADWRKNFRRIPRQDNRKANSIENREGAKRFCDKRLKIEPNDLVRKTHTHSATKGNEQSPVDNKKNSKSSIPSEKVDKSSTDVKKSDKSAMTLNDTPSNDIFKDIITTKSYLTDYFNFGSNLSVVDMEISSQGSSPKRRKILESCVDRGMETKELKNIPEETSVIKIEEGKKSESSEDNLKNTANIKGSKELQNAPEKNNVMKKTDSVKKVSSQDNIKNAFDVKRSQELQNTPEKNRERKKSEEAKRGVSSDNKLKNTANTSGINDKNQETKSKAKQKFESARKIVEGDNKVDMLYKRSESEAGLSYQVLSGYTIPKKTQVPQPSRKRFFSDIDDVYSTDARKLFEDPAEISKSTDGVSKRKNDVNSFNSFDKNKPHNTSTSGNHRLHPDKTSSIHRDSEYSSYTSKPENNAVRLGTCSKVSNERRRSPTDSSNIESNVPINIRRSENAVPKKISSRIYSDHRRSLDASKSESSRSPLSPFRSPVDTSSSGDSNLKSTNCNRPHSSSKSCNLGRNTDHSISPPKSSRSVDRRESTDRRSNRTQSLDTSQNVYGSENVLSNRRLFKNSNQIRPGLDARRGNGSHSTLKSDSVDGTRKAKRSSNRPADDGCFKKRKEGGSDESIRTTGRNVSLSDNSRDAEYDSSSQDSSHSAKSRDIVASKNSGSELSDEGTRSSRDWSYKKEEQTKSNNVCNTRKTSSDSESTKFKQTSDEDKGMHKISFIDIKRNSLDSKVERSKLKGNMNNSNGISAFARRNGKRDKQPSAAIVFNNTRKQTSSEVESQNKTNNVKYKETIEREGINKSESGQPNDSGLTSKKRISNTAELIVIIEKASAESASLLDKTHCANASTKSGLIKLFDDSTVKTSTFGLSYSNTISSDKENACTGVTSDTNEKVPFTYIIDSNIIDSNGHYEDIELSNTRAIESKYMEEEIHIDSINDTTNQKCDERYNVRKDNLTDKTTNEAASQTSLATDLRIVDPLEEAVKSIVNGKVVSEDILATLGKISASNNDGKLKGSSNKLQDTSMQLDQERVEMASGTGHDDSNIVPMEERSEMCVNNVGKLIDGNNTVLIEAKQKNESNSPQKNESNSPKATKIPLDIKSHIISSPVHDMYTEENLGNIDPLFDGKNTVLVSASEVNIQAVESKICDAEVFTVNICKPLSVKIHEVSYIYFEADRCSSLPDFTFELNNARSSWIKSLDYGTVTILKPIGIIESSVYVFNKMNLEEQDIPIIDLVDDKADVPIIDLTEEADVKKEDQIDNTSDIYEILNKATGISEHITLYRSDETVNDSLDVQATSVSISPLKSGSYEVKQESDIEDGVKKEMDEESDEPDSIFTEIELLNISRKVARPKEVEMEVDQPAAAEVHIKDELDNSIPDRDSKADTVTHSSVNTGKVPVETLEKEKEPQNAIAQYENLLVQNATDVLPTDNMMLGNESTCSTEHTSGNDSAVKQVATAPNMPELNCQGDLTNQDCVTASNVVEDRHEKPIQEKVVEVESVQAEIVDASHEIDHMIEREEDSQAKRKRLTSQPKTNIASIESGKEDSLSAKKSLRISTLTTRATILQNEVLCPSVVSQPSVSPPTFCQASRPYGTDNTIQRNIPQANREEQILQNPPDESNIDTISQLNVLRAVPDKSCSIPQLQVTQRSNTAQSLGRDEGTETQPPSIIETKDSRQQHDIWNVTGILMRFIDPAWCRIESNVIPELHDKRLAIYAAAMKATFEQYTFNLPPIPADVLKVTFNRVRKVLPLPQLDMKWIIFALLSLMKKEASFYYTHVSLKYLYIYIISANQQLNGLKRQDQLGQQEQSQQNHQQKQYLAPDQLSALKNQIQQFNNICSTQQQLFNPKPQKTKKTTQRKRAPKQSKGAKNTKVSCTNETSQVKSRQSQPTHAQSASSRLQDSNNNSTKIASAINPKILVQLLQAMPTALSSVQSSSHLSSDIMSSPTHTMSAYNPSPDMSPAHVTTPTIRLKDPSSLMQDTLKASQTNANMTYLERMLDKFPCVNSSNSTRQNMSIGNLNCLGSTPRSIHMTPTFGTVSSPMHQLSNLTGIIDGRNTQKHVYAPLPKPAYMPPIHSTVTSQSMQSNVPTSSAGQHGVIPAQQLSNLARTIHTTIASPGGSPACYLSPHHQISNVPVTNESEKSHVYVPRPYRPPPAYSSPSHNIASSQGVPNSSGRQCNAVSPVQQFSGQTRDMGHKNTSRLPTGSYSYMSPAHMSSPAHRPFDRTESTGGMVYAPTALSNISCIQNRVSNPNLHSVGMSPVHNYFMTSPAHRISDKTESTSRVVCSSTTLPNVPVHETPVQSGEPDHNLQSVGMPPAHISAMSSSAQQTFDKTESTSRSVYYSELIQNLLGHMSPAQSAALNRNVESVAVSPVHSPGESETLDETGSIAASISRKLSEFISRQTVSVHTTSSSIPTPRISLLSSNKSLSDTIVRSPAHRFGTTQASGQTACMGSGFLNSSNESAHSARTCPATSSANNVLSQLGTRVYAGSTSDSPASTPRISPSAPTGSLTTTSSMLSNEDNRLESSMSASPVMASTPAHETPLAANTHASLRIHLDDDEGPGVTPVYAPMLFPRRYDQLSTSTASPSPVSHISDDVEVIDLTWIDDLDEERLDMEVDEMVKKEELGDDEEVIINNIEHFAVINDSQKYPPE